LEHLHRFTTQAWRRPLLPEESAQLDSLYADGRAKGIDREARCPPSHHARACLAKLPVQAETCPYSLETIRPLIPKPPVIFALRHGSWLHVSVISSGPPCRMNAAPCSRGCSLLKPEVLRCTSEAHVGRPRASAMAKEFAGQWLGFEDFASFSGADQKKYPEFTDNVRHDMYPGVDLVKPSTEHAVFRRCSCSNTSRTVGGHYARAFLVATIVTVMCADHISRKLACAWAACCSLGHASAAHLLCQHTTANGSWNCVKTHAPP